MRTQLVVARIVAEALADAADEPGIENGTITDAYAEGAALPDPGARLAGPSLEEWLAATKA
jgi:hypothetical protein